MPLILPIHDAGDERLRLYRNVRDRDLTGRDGLFMAEGQVVLERLFRSKFCVCMSVLTTYNRLKNLDILWLDASTPIYIVAEDMMADIVGFDIHRGYLALGRYINPGITNILTSPKSLRIVALSAIANVDNMGGLMRNAAAFGTDAVLIDRACCDPLYRKAIRVGVGGVFHVPHFRVDDLIGTLSAFGITPYALSPSGTAALDDIMPSDRCAFVFGAEGPGLAPAVLGACTSVRIAMSGGFDSLNVATTSGIVLYHMCRR